MVLICGFVVAASVFAVEVYFYLQIKKLNSKLDGLESDLK